MNIESFFTSIAIKLNKKSDFIQKTEFSYHIVSKCKLYIMFKDPASRNPINEKLKMFLEAFLGEDKLVDFQGKFQQFNL